MPKNPRVRRHVRRHMSRRYPDYELQQFVEHAGRIPQGVEPQELLAALAESDELWELIAEAASLKRQRDEVVEKIEKLRNSIVKPFEKKAKAAKK